VGLESSQINPSLCPRNNSHSHVTKAVTCAEVCVSQHKCHRRKMFKSDFLRGREVEEDVLGRGSCVCKGTAGMKRHNG
jgi:hypothetical protein